MDSLTIGEIATALGFLVALIGSIEFILFRVKNYIKNLIQSEINPLKEELKKNSLNTMKNTICNENIPLSERLAVGKEYIEQGGNGAVKIYYHKLEEEFEKKLQKEERL